MSHAIFHVARVRRPNVQHDGKYETRVLASTYNAVAHVVFSGNADQVVVTADAQVVAFDLLAGFVAVERSGNFMTPAEQTKLPGLRCFGSWVDEFPQNKPVRALQRETFAVIVPGTGPLRADRLVQEGFFV